jgi:wyosine [tRNA(Phe)-imidazoG37] synthetase (radical SAM superfamily)
MKNPFNSLGSKKNTVHSEIRLVIKRNNFWDLNPIISELELKKQDELPRFKLLPFSTIYTRFINYKLAVKEKVAYLNNKYEADIFLYFDADLDNILRKFQNDVSKEIKDDRKMLRLLGSVCNHAFIGPEYFHLDISNPCNIDCNYCWFYSDLLKSPPSKEWKKHMIKFNLFKKVVDDLARLQTDTILFTGAGEPLMHPDIAEMIRYVKDRNMKLQIFTNGTLIIKKIADTIVDCKADEIFVSPSASNEKTYMKVHPKQKPELFYKLEKNIIYLSSLKKQKKSTQPKIFILFILNKENYNELLEMVRWSKKIGGDFVRLQLAHNDDAKEMELSNEERRSVREKMHEAKALAQNLKISIDDNIFIQLDGTKKSNEWYKEVFKKGCFVGWNFSRLWADGDVSFCCIKKKVKNIKDSGNFLDLWNSGHYSNYRSAARKYDPKTNIKLGKDYHLMDKDCQHCGNMEVNEAAYDDLKRYGLLEFIS